MPQHTSCCQGFMENLSHQSDTPQSDLDKPCECSRAGECPRLGGMVSKRYYQFCQGTSGLPRSKELAYLEKLRQEYKREPSLLRKAYNLATATTEHILAGLPIVSDAEFASRIAICEKCPEFTEKRSCLKCGCRMDFKAKWAEQKCPLSKWADPPPASQ